MLAVPRLRQRRAAWVSVLGVKLTINFAGQHIEKITNLTPS